jgi:hypothetical protein
MLTYRREKMDYERFSATLLQDVGALIDVRFVDITVKLI